MAIIKMSKMRVIGLLEEKEKVYNFLQNKAKVHIAQINDLENLKVDDNSEKIASLFEKEQKIDGLITYVEAIFNMPEEKIDIQNQGIESIKQKQNDLENHLNVCENLKTKIEDIEKEIENIDTLIETLISHAEEKLSTLKQNKLIFIDFEKDMPAKEYISLIKETKKQKQEEIAGNKQTLKTECENNLTDLKLLRDYISLEIENLKGDTLIQKTESTFVLDFYLPQENEEYVFDNLKNLSSCLCVEKIKIEKNENVPTMTKNNKVVSQAEFVTNMYSVPSYNERDPNTLVFWFFMIFFGYIMADIGLGIALIALGLFLSSKNKEGSGSKKLWNLIGIGGVFAIVWGILYNSFFGFAILPFTIMPDPKEQAILTLLICLLMGVIHISSAYFMKGLNALKNNSVIDAIFDGFLWDSFFLGAVMALSKFLLQFFNIVDFSINNGLTNFLTQIQMPGIIILCVSLGLIALFAGRYSKGIFGKIIKGFTSIYGIINLFSDILSYARLFGLMLSGAIIGQQFDQIGINLMSGGSVFGIIFGVVVIIIGNGFNLAMGALGAYIHDCRLQYIEGFGKFYTGDGVLFKPFRPEFKYITLSEN